MPGCLLLWSPAPVSICDFPSFSTSMVETWSSFSTATNTWAGPWGWNLPAISPAAWLICTPKEYSTGTSPPRLVEANWSLRGETEVIKSTGVCLHKILLWWRADGFGLFCSSRIWARYGQRIDRKPFCIFTYSTTRIKCEAVRLTVGI